MFHRKQNTDKTEILKIESDENSMNFNYTFKTNWLNGNINISQ